MNLSYFVLIDTDFREHETFQLALDESGHLCDLVSYFEGGEAIKMFNSHFGGIPNYIFIGSDSVGQTDLELFKAIKEIVGFNRVQIVLYTSKVSLSDILKADDLGVSYIILKQADKSGLSKILRALLTKSILPFYMSGVL